MKALFYGGIFLSAHVIHELINERIFIGDLNGPNSMISLALLYSLFQQLFCSLLGYIMMKRDDDHSPSWRICCIISVLIAISASCSHYAVSLVYYPAKVVIKSTKLIPVMIISPCFGNSKSFTRLDFVAAGVLCLGASIFALSSSRWDHSQEVSFSGFLGFLLLGIASIGDSIVPNYQEKLMREGSSPESIAFKVNICSSLFLLLYLLLNGDLNSWILFWKQDLRSLFTLVFGGIVFSIGVLSYTFLISQVGSVITVSITLVRRIVTLMLSYLVFPDKQVSLLNLIGLCVFICGIVIGNYSSKQRKEVKYEQL